MSKRKSSKNVLHDRKLLEQKCHFCVWELRRNFCKQCHVIQYEVPDHTCRSVKKMLVFFCKNITLWVFFKFIALFLDNLCSIFQIEQIFNIDFIVCFYFCNFVFFPANDSDASCTHYTAAARHFRLFNFIVFFFLLDNRNKSILLRFI